MDGSAESIGSISGVTLGENPVLRITNIPQGNGPWFVAADFSQIPGGASANWQVEFGEDVPANRFFAAVTESGVKFGRKGMVVLIR